MKQITLRIFDGSQHLTQCLVKNRKNINSRLNREENSHEKLYYSGRWKILSVWNKQHFSSTKVAFPKIDTSCARVFNFTLFVCLSSPPFHSNSFSIKSSYPIIVTSRTRFATSPQSFLRPKDSQITAVTRSNFDPTTSPGIQTRPTCLRLLPGL